MIKQPADTWQREQALDPKRSFICEAPAGSGKTELLTQRVLTLLARVEKPESIFAITFTRKAAAEMRDRILSALHSGQGTEPESAHQKKTWLLAQQVLSEDKKRGWQLLQNPNRLQISTFDSLCAKLTRTLPLQSSLGANIGPTENVEPLLREAARATLDTLEQDMPWSAHVATLLRHLDNQYARLEELFIKMLRSRDAWMPVLQTRRDMTAVREFLQEHLQTVVDDEVVRLHERIPARHQQALLQLAGFAASQVQRLDPECVITLLSNIELQGELPGSDCEGVQHWQAIAQLLLTQKGTWRARLDKKCGFPAGENKEEKAACKLQKQNMLALIAAFSQVPGLLEQLNEIAFWPQPLYSESQWQILQALTELLPILVAQLQLVFRAHGEVDFSEISSRARLALGEPEAPTELALRLDHRIQHLLVDEFQDTSFSQFELLQKLTAGWEPDDGRTLFCVGDAMQSIYSFRGGNVGLFMHCKAFGLGDVTLESLQLTTNFRSQAGVVQWINRVFKDAFPPENDISSGAVGFALAEEFLPALPGMAVQTHVYSEDYVEQQEGQWVRHLIAEAWAEDENASVAILVRNRQHALNITPQLTSAGLRYRAVDLDPLIKRSVVQDLSALCRALLSPTDRIAWLSVLRAPWCGLTLRDLEVVAQQKAASVSLVVAEQLRQILSDGHQLLSRDGFQRLQRVVPVLQQAVAVRERRPLRQWVEGVWVSLGGPASLQHAADLDNVERFLQLLESLSSGGEQPSLDVIDQGLAALYAAPDPGADGRLQIMTIHRSKGLEFDVVIIPGLHRQPRSPDPELLLWQERLSRCGEDHLLLAPISATGRDKDGIYKHLEYQKKKREHLESCRLLYVACTRAKKNLHLLARVRAEGEETKTFKAPSKGALLGHIWSSVKSGARQLTLEDFTGGNIHPSPSGADSQFPYATPLRRLPVDWRLPELPRVTLLNDFIPHFEFDNNATNAPQARESYLPRHIGTLIHQILQSVGQQGLAWWQNKNLNECVPFWRARLLDLGVAPDALTHALNQVVDCIARVLIHPRTAWMLEPHKVARFEFPVSTASKDGTINSVIDVLLEDETGRAWVIDYKTSAPEEGVSEAHFIEQEKQHYAAPMARYRRVAEQLGYRSVTCALFFVVTGHWVEL